MAIPERIHINWGAADGYERFRACGLPATSHYPLTPENITHVLAQQKGRLFRLIGTTEDYTAVMLSISDYEEPYLLVRNNIEPSFEDHFMVASEPPPLITTHGDYTFDLVRRSD